MVVPPREAQISAAGNVGMYPWRVPPGQRVCHDAIASEGTAGLFSPFEAEATPVPVTPDSSLDELAITLTSWGPAWHSHIMPLWPALWHPHLCFVPAPDDPRLVCVMVVSTDWQLPLLMPRRSDANWLLALLQRIAPDAVSTLHRPVQVSPPAAGQNEAIDWRDGDVILAMGPLGMDLHDPPCFVHGFSVRTAAIWAADFRCEGPITVVLWTPGHRPIRTTMPPGSHWRANCHSFDGDFQQRYPGRWGPVPWAYSHDVHLCLRAGDDISCNIIVEELTGDRLMGEADAWPPLRDGDILHFNHADRVLKGYFPMAQQVTCLKSVAPIGTPHWDASYHMPLLVLPKLWRRVFGAATWFSKEKEMWCCIEVVLYYQVLCGYPDPPELEAATRRDGVTSWGLLWLAVYLAAYGAPRWTCHDQGGVPDELFLATDGSGVGDGSWAFAAWGLFKGIIWHRLDWAADTLPRTAWAVSDRAATAGVDTRSYQGELVALQSAAMWSLAQLDQWSLHMGSMPALVTIAVDNSSAMLVAAGHASAEMTCAAADWMPPPAVQEVPAAEQTPKPEPVPLRVATANVQRRAAALAAGGGWLTWRSGAAKGQYGCEIWVDPQVTAPPLQLGDWRIIHSCPRILAVTCVAASLPVTIVSAHAPHAVRPDEEAKRFWDCLASVLQNSPQNRALVVGIDANGDFCSADDEGWLVGSLLSPHEPARNDDCLLELCLRFSLQVPATFTDTQVGEGWSWQHTSHKRKRLDHLLFQAGPWEVSQTSQALAFDIVNVQQDHVAVWAQTTLRAPAPARRRDGSRRCTPNEVQEHGSAIWAKVDAAGTGSCGEQVQQLLDQYDSWRRDLPAKAPLTPKQPYIQAFLQRLSFLRDWRAQVRLVKRDGCRLLLSLCVQGWRPRRFDTRVPHLQWHQHRLLEAAMVSQEYRLGRLAHNSAKRDKVAHFLQLTTSAVELWHREGRAMEAIAKLCWASRRAAERRSVHAAGGYCIEDALEEQFRAQEGGRFVSRDQIRIAQASWASCPAPACERAVPTLLQLEAACRRQQGLKAPGPDLVLNELWRHFPARAGHWFWHLCSKAVLTGHEPPQFKLALICALYKKGPAALPENYRSIALMNGMAKVYHGYLRRGIGHSILSQYEGLQLGGKPGIPVSFAVAAFRIRAWSLSAAAQRSCAALFIDIRAAYYEASRDLIFDGGQLALAPNESRLRHLCALTDQLARAGALQLLGVPPDEIALLRDCVACAHWQLVGSNRMVLATKGSRPGDGLADVLFGSLFAIALRHIQETCKQEGLACHAVSIAAGSEEVPLQIGWADDLAILTDYSSPRELQARFARVAEIAIDTLHALRFSVNLGAGKTEALLEIRGAEAKAVRGELFGHAAPLQLANGETLRLTPEYRYLGVIQQPKDSGRRDNELSAQRGHTAWAHARSLLTSEALPWALRQAWVAGRILPAAYATLATSCASSDRATAPLQGLFERVARVVCGSWKHGHLLHRTVLLCLLGLAAPEHAVVIARARLVTQLVAKAPSAVWDLFDAAWNRAVPWCELLADACRLVARQVPRGGSHCVPTSLAFIRQHQRDLAKACRFLSRWGTIQWAFSDLWQALTGSKTKRVLGQASPSPCPLCGAMLPSAHALAAHVHRKHSVVNWLTRFTHGTTCLWCHQEMHSSDRLKYHLRTSPACVHGLRVTVGEVYQYGTGTRRRGPGGHRGVPAIRLPGPLNATPAQRHAAEAGRPCTEAELTHELFTATGAAHPYEWPDLAGPGLLGPPLRDEPVEPIVNALPPALPQFMEAASVEPSQNISGSPAHPVSPGVHNLPAEAPLSADSCEWKCIFEWGEDAAAWHLPSPLWAVRSKTHTVWQLPRAWHRFWKCWNAIDRFHPWDSEARPAYRVLRSSVASVCPSSREAPVALYNLLAATVTIRQVCLRVCSGGAVWCWGVPSRDGVAVLRRLLPEAFFRTVNLPGGAVFAAHHPSCPPSWWPALLALCSPVPRGPSPCVRPLRATFIFRTEPLGHA
ncbi:unnamed protein product [Symbiodinium sp. CCMP2592]|nr:unnamed protein product [Symbiodinium sp. CCMP2592]